MKTMFKSIAVVAFIASSSNAFAGMLRTVSFENLKLADSHHESVTKSIDAKIDLANREVVLYFNPCAKGELCVIEHAEVISVSAPLKSITKDACGSTVYSASVDRRPVDGALTEIQITDNSTSRCYFHEFKTEGSLRTEFISRMNAESIVKTSSFSTDDKLLTKVIRTPRICTMITGKLVSKETGVCAVYTNGCQRSDMLNSKKFALPEDGQCQ